MKQSERLLILVSLCLSGLAAQTPDLQKKLDQEISASLKKAGAPRAFRLPSYATAPWFMRKLSEPPTWPRAEQRM
jgi:hypothetical protein